jgi:hypothetical protein
LGEDLREAEDGQQDPDAELHARIEQHGLAKERECRHEQAEGELHHEDDRKGVHQGSVPKRGPGGHPYTVLRDLPPVLGGVGLVKREHGQEHNGYCGRCSDEIGKSWPANSNEDAPNNGANDETKAEHRPDHAQPLGAPVRWRDVGYICLGDDQVSAGESIEDACCEENPCRSSKPECDERQYCADL